MGWIFKKFWWVIGAIGAFWGALWFAADYEQRAVAFEALGKLITVSNLETALAALCAVLIARLAYLDIRRALSDSDWPPVRERLRRLLGILFKKDARVAELQVLAGDGKRLRKVNAEKRLAAIHEKRMGQALKRQAAREVLEYDELNDNRPEAGRIMRRG